MPEPSTETCNILIKIDGAEEIKATSEASWSIKSGVNITSLSVDQRLDAPDAFSVQFLGTREGEKTVLQYAKQGAQIELGFSYDGPAEPNFKGEVVYLEFEVDVEAGTFVTLRGYDHSHRLTRGMSAKKWGEGDTEEVIISDTVSDVIDESRGGLSPDQVDSTEFKSRYIPKAMTTDYDFIKWAGSNLARASDSAADDGKKVSFRKLDIQSNPVATVCYDKMEGTNPIRTIRTRFQISTYPQYKKVRVHGWNSKDKKAFVGEVETCSPEVDCANANGWEAGWKTAELYAEGGDQAVYERVAEFCESKEEAEKLAQGMFDSFSLRYLTGEADVLGWPEIAPGKVVQFMGFGDRVDGKVLVTECSHHVSATAGQPYITSFKFCANAAGKAS